MSDRHLCKAKGIYDGEWAEGYYVKCRGQHYILPVYDEILGYDDKFEETAEWIEIDLSTLCQCTGLKDKNGKLIFEKDIIKCKEIITAVSWNTKYAGWVLTKKGWIYSHFFGESQEPEECEVIGNVFDNPELLEGGAE